VETQTRTGSDIARRAVTVGIVLVALLVPVWAPSGDSDPDTTTVAQAPGDGAAATAGDDDPTADTTPDTTDTAGDTTTTTDDDPDAPDGPDAPGDGDAPVDGDDPDADEAGHGDTPDDGDASDASDAEGVPDGEMQDGHAPPHGRDASFPDDWTPEQVAFAEELIAGTEAGLERYRNPGILPLLGFTWILDGTEPGGYQHWVNLPWFEDGHVLDPAFPESLVFRNTAAGPQLEAAMYMLPWRYDLTNIPDDIAFLPGWHVHDNLCFDGSGRIVGVAENGVCTQGSLVVTPPMLHVWLDDTPCGRFAGVDEHGLQCDHGH
jgi:hypothetical protein